MKKYISILRGINVGGRRKILMADLKKLYEDLGYKNIVTYIQSGNVIFQSDDLAVDIRNNIEEAINTHYGFDVPVIVIQADKIRTVINNNPFFGTDEEKLHVTFLGKTPEKRLVKELQEIDIGKDKFLIIGKYVYILCEGKYHESKLTNNFFERKLGVRATTRNWKTVNKLVELSSK